MPFPTDANYLENIETSLEYFLNTNIVLPYNDAVLGTAHAKPLSIMMEDPDDYSTVEQVPVLVLCEPSDFKPASSTGMGDGEVWVYPNFSIMVYPGTDTDPVSGSFTPSRASANVLRSLFLRLSTALVMPLYDFTASSTVPVLNAYVDSARVSDAKGPMRDMLAMEKHRFNFDMRLRFTVATLNG